ncbi:integrase core domain protein [Ostertagia ostertagi]
MAQACDICAAFGKEMREHRCIPGKRQQKAKQKVWQRLHMDFAETTDGRRWLVIVDAKSKWPEVVQMGLTTVEKTIEKLKDIFSLHDLPEQIVVDNGPQFIAKEFKEYCRRRSIELIFIPPYHHNSNGEAERFVQTLRRVIIKGGRPMRRIKEQYDKKVKERKLGSRKRKMTDKMKEYVETKRSRVGKQTKRIAQIGAISRKKGIKRAASGGKPHFGKNEAEDIPHELDTRSAGGACECTPDNDSSSYGTAHYVGHGVGPWGTHSGVSGLARGRFADSNHYHHRRWSVASHGVVAASGKWTVRMMRTCRKYDGWDKKRMKED